MTTSTKRVIADGPLRAEICRLARLVPDIDRADDAIAELVAAFTVYRSYLPLGAEYLEQALKLAAHRRPVPRPDPVATRRTPAGQWVRAVRPASSRPAEW